MKTAFILFENMTALDLMGIYDPLTRLKSMNYILTLRALFFII